MKPNKKDQICNKLKKKKSKPIDNVPILFYIH